MLSRLIRMRWPIPVGVIVVIAGVVGLSVASARDDGDALVIYNGRSHYGDEAVFTEFEEMTGIDLEVRGGTGPELFERLVREGDDTPADLLVTTDLANLWRAEDAGLLQTGITSPELEANIPESLRDPQLGWWALTTRLRVPVVSTERVPEGAVTRYEDLGDPQYRGRTCLRTSANEYNQSFVADRIAKYGLDATRELLESWMANDPEIINSDGELLGAMAAGECDLGLVNHYYLGRALAEDPGFPVAPAWPDQDGAGAHANVSGVGVVRSSDQQDDAIRLMEWLTSAEAQQEFTMGSEFAANPDVPPADHIADWADVREDPIAADAVGPLLSQAIELMLEVGWN
jgi:iron(III) transport system substrate-binding protein